MKRGLGRTESAKVQRRLRLHSTSVELIKKLAQKHQTSQARVIEIALEKYGKEMKLKRNHERVQIVSEFKKQAQ